MDCLRKHFGGPYQCPLCQGKLHKTGGVVTYSRTGKLQVAAADVQSLQGCQKLHSDDHLKCQCGYEVETELAWLAERYKQIIRS